MMLEETLKHPYSAVVAGVTLVTGTLGYLDPLIQFVGATAGTWYPLVGILWRLGDVVPSIPQEAMTSLFVAGTVVYALYLGGSLLDRLQKFIKDRI